jgi:prolyl-tRNA editing enzyme YbaK/EbsC (Cys-tRNA(Pro) deacylase)
MATDPVSTGPDGGRPVHTNTLRVIEALRAAGADGAVRTLPDSATTAVAAANQLGVEVGAIANSLVFEADGAPLLVLTSGAHRVDTERVARLLGVGAIRRASPDFVRTATGQPIGGVAPVGHPAPVRTIVDVALRTHDAVWAAAGTPHTVFPTTYDELVAMTGGTPAEVGD